MKIAIMQPYFFPYVGYYQMVNYVDTFVFLDDVNYIKKGWINRNKIVVNGGKPYFSVPLKKASQNKHICDIELSTSYATWRAKFLKTLAQAYGKCISFPECSRLVTDVLFCGGTNISELSAASITQTSAYLGMKTDFLFSSDLRCNGKREHKLLNICKNLGATTYVNTMGGRSLYNKEWFANHNIELEFIEPSENTEHLSIIHSLMYPENPIDLDHFNIK
jgi:hypothetical protein